MLVNELSFSRISLEPAYYDDRQGVVQQYDGIYYRPDAKPREPASMGIGEFTVATSIGGAMERKATNGEPIGEKWLRACAQSWTGISARVCSVSEEAPPEDGVAWLETPLRPSVAEIIRTVARSPEDFYATKSHIILTNADIALTDGFKRILPALDPLTLYYGARFDSEASLEPSGRLRISGRDFYRLGFDFFILPPGFIRFVNQDKIIPDDFQIGFP